MKYLGGKHRMARGIATLVNALRGGRRWWDPFCGGLSVSLELAKTSPGTSSDVNAALIAFYQGIVDGWVPPNVVTEEDWKAAKELPDSDPMKAFVGFGCSFGAMYFNSYARDPAGQTNYAASSARWVRKARAEIRKLTIEQKSFFDEEPRPLPLIIYADPPYASTTGYRGIDAFDHERFWATVQEWEGHGVPVLVSEYACPVDHEVLWRRETTTTLASQMTQGEARVEKVIRVKR